MSQDLSTLRNFFAFGRWANRSILESVAVLTPEEYARPIGGSFGSVQGTLFHQLVYTGNYHGDREAFSEWEKPGGAASEGIPLRGR